VDDVLARIIEDIIALPDIPELESHRLGDLCKLLNPLEELFRDDTEKGSPVRIYFSSLTRDRMGLIRFWLSRRSLRTYHYG
jgi:hypothetical protein